MFLIYPLKDKYITLVFKIQPSTVNATYTDIAKHVDMPAHAHTHIYTHMKVGDKAKGKDMESNH